MGPLAEERRRRGGSTGQRGGGGGVGPPAEEEEEGGGWRVDGRDRRVEMPGYNIFEKCLLFRSRID